MVLLWIQVQNKMEEKTQLLSNQRREWIHMWEEKKKQKAKGSGQINNNEWFPLPFFNLM